MKSILAVALIAGFVAAEVPSHSYLPPPPRGYPQASSPPSVIAARTLEGLNPENYTILGATGVSSSPEPVDHSTPTPQPRFGTADQGYDQNVARYRTAIDDANTTVSYEADDRTFKPQNRDGSDATSTRSPGYDNNAEIFRANNGYTANDQYGVRNSNGYQDNGQDGRARRSHGLH